MNELEGAVSRRKLLIGAGATAVAAAAYSAPGLPLSLLPGKTGTGAPNLWHRQYWTLEAAGAAEWNRQIGRSFYIRGGGITRWVKLVQVDALPSPGERPEEVARKAAFSVLFEARWPLPFERDRIHVVGSQLYREMQIFLGGTDPRRMRAIFN